MSASISSGDSTPRVSLWPWVYVVAIAYFGLNLATSMRYGYFRDALYYLACADHLDFGYVDLPPLFPVIAWIARHTLGTSLPALIFWPALAGAGRIVFIAAFARELGAGRFGTALAAVLGATPAVWWVIDHQFAMNALESLLWTGCAWAILRMIKTENPKLWLAFGAIAGLGLENKYSIAIFAFALLAGLSLTPERRLLFTPWLPAGGAVALLIFLPNLIWNIHHHWPFLELMHNIRATGKDIVLPPGAYLGQQILMMNPLSFPFWFGGLFFYFSKRARAFRAFGWAFVITIALFLALHDKDYYSAPAYPLVLAGGAVLTERLLESWRRPWATAALRPTCFVWLIAGVLLALPLVLPILRSRPSCATSRTCRPSRPLRNTALSAPPCPNTTPMNFPGKTWWLRRPAFTTRFRPATRPKLRSSATTTGRQRRSTFLAGSMGCPKPSAAIRTIFCGARENTQEKS